MKKILSIIIAAVFLVSSVGVSIGTHYCGGKVHERSLLLAYNDMSCGMENTDQDSPCENTGATFSKNCCENDSQSIKIEDEYQGSSFKIKLDHNFTAAFLLACINVISTDTAVNASYRYYKPPKLKKNLFVLVQSFLL